MSEPKPKKSLRMRAPKQKQPPKPPRSSPPVPRRKKGEVGPKGSPVSLDLSDPEHRKAVLYEYARRVKAARADKPRPWCPQRPTKKQLEFLKSENFEGLYGGSAGGGKSSCLLMGALQYINVAGYSAILFRRKYTDLALSGALMDRAEQWLRNSPARWHGTDKVWVFPSGARLQFGYLATEQDKYRYQSAEFQYVGFDELTQFTESQYTYLLSRVRRTEGLNVPLRVRSATNPGGSGHRWVYERFVAPETRGERLFVPAKLEDNPHLNQEEYRGALSLLDATTRRQLLDGEWILDTTGLIYHLEQKNIVNECPSRLLYVLAIDLGASARDATTAFAIIGYSYSRKNVWLVKSWAMAGLTPSDIAEQIRRLSVEYPPSKIVMDAGALGAGYVEEMRQRHSLPVEPARKQNKAGYRKLLNGDLERGTFLVVAGPPGGENNPNAQAIEEMGSLMWDEKGRDAHPGQPDHITDAILYGWREARHWLAQEVEVAPTDPTEFDRWTDRKMEENEEMESSRPWWDG